MNASGSRIGRLLRLQKHVVNITQNDIVDAYPQLIEANEGPVVDTSAACMVRLAEANRAAGNIVALTGEGADEALAGYVWFKKPQPGAVQRWLNRPLERLGREFVLSTLIGGRRTHRPNFFGAGGIRFHQQITWEIIGQSRETLYSPRCGNSSAIGPPTKTSQFHSNVSSAGIRSISRCTSDTKPTCRAYS